jgi:predicted Fe-Mo cluster-binding NifX family protein
MVICIPVSQDEGLKSRVSAHFGSAPFFMLVDAEQRTLRTVPNRNQHHAHGQCQPLAAIQGEQVDAIVVGGIGAGALARIQAAGVEVLWSDLRTVEETLDALGGPGLQRVAPAHTCGHHHGGEGHGHGGPGGCHH